MPVETHEGQHAEHEQNKKHERKMYLVFAGMITTSTVTMFLEDIERNGPATSEEEAQQRPVPELGAAP